MSALTCVVFCHFSFWKDKFLYFCFVEMATAKLNKEKMKKLMSQKDEAPISLGKRWKTNSSSKKMVDERSLPPSRPDSGFVG